MNEGTAGGPRSAADEHPAVVYVRVLLDEQFPTRAKRVLAGGVVLMELVGALSILASGQDSPGWVAPVGWVLVIVGGLAILIFGLLLPVATIIRNAQACERREQDRRTHCESRGGLHDCLVSQYGFERESVEVAIAIQKDGAATVEDTVTVVARDNKITELRHFMEGGTTGGEPQQNFGVEPVMLKCPVGYSFEDVVATPHRVSWGVKFNPELPAGEPVTYSFRVRAPKGAFLMTAASVKQSDFPYEWLSHEVVYPCRRLEMTVTFPTGFGWTKFRGEVWCDDAMLVCESETRMLAQRKLVKGSMAKDGRQCLKLTVENPILGMKYAVLWVPKEPRPSRRRT